MTALLFATAGSQICCSPHMVGETSASDQVMQSQGQQALNVHDRRNQWFFAEAVAKSMWELAMYAENLTLDNPAERVQQLHEVYITLIGVEGDLAFKRNKIAEEHAITDELMSHSASALTSEQEQAFEAYLSDVIALHRRAHEIVERDAFLRTHYERLLTVNGMTVFWERLHDLLRSKQPQREPGDKLYL